MDRLEMIIVNEVSETDQDEYHMILPICGIKKKVIQMNIFTKQKQTHRHRMQTCNYHMGKVGGREKFRIWD